MPWQEQSIVEQRAAFIATALAEGANRRAVCRAFGISPTTGYKWLARSVEGTLCDRSRRPHRSPGASPPELVEAVLAVRLAHPVWGGRKIHHYLRQREVAAPHPNTITDILRRHGLVDPLDSQQHRPFIRFEHAYANALWQMDFKGHFAVGTARCHPLTVVDDHSRFATVLQACADQRRETVVPHLTAAFRHYGLPERMLMDNGPPWGTDQGHRHTELTVWLMRLGIAPCHGRPYHPQTQGKNERFNRTLKAEVLRERRFDSLAMVQTVFDHWRDLYNHDRPHQSLDDRPPARRFQPSPRQFPEHLPPIEYPAGSCVRRVQRVQRDGRISFAARQIFLSRALQGQPVALIPSGSDGCLSVLYCSFHVAVIDLRDYTQTQ